MKASLFYTSCKRQKTSDFPFLAGVERAQPHNILKHCKRAPPKINQGFLPVQMLHENLDSKGFKEIEKLQSFLYYQCYALNDILILTLYLDIINAYLYIKYIIFKCCL